MAVEGQPRDDNIGVFTAWRQLLLQSAYMCCDSGEDGKDATCLEVEVRKASFAHDIPYTKL